MDHVRDDQAGTGPPREYRDDPEELAFSFKKLTPAQTDRAYELEETRELVPEMVRRYWTERWPCTDIISPWAKPGYIEKGTLEFPSVLKFIQRVFDLPPLGQRDRQASDMLSVFDFKQQANRPPILAERPCD